MSLQAPRGLRNKPGRKTTAPPAWTCPKCSRSITNLADAGRHLAGHMPRKHFCPHAGCRRNTEGFTQRSHLNTHVNSVHTKSKTYVCALCPKSYFDPASLNRHRQVAHGGQKQQAQKAQKVQNDTIDLTLPSVVDYSAYTPVAGPSSQQYAPVAGPSSQQYAPVAGPSSQQYVKMEQAEPVLLQSFSPVAGPSGLHPAPAPEFGLKPEDVDSILNGAFHCGTFGDFQGTQFLPPSAPAPECSEVDLLAGMEKWLTSPEYMYPTAPAPTSYYNNALGFDAQPQSYPFPYAQPPAPAPAPVPAPTPAPYAYTQPGYGTIDPSALMLAQPPLYTHEQQAALAAAMGAGAVPYLPSRETSSSPFGNESVAGGPALSPADVLAMQQCYSYGDYMCWQ